MRIYFRALTGTARKRVVVYGAGDSGVQLVKALALSKEYQPVAFIDDDEALHQRLVHGLPVYPSGHLRTLVSKLSLSQVLLAMPSVSPVRRAEILASLDSLPVRVKTLPSLSDWYPARRISKISVKSTSRTCLAIRASYRRTRCQTSTCSVAS